MDQKKDNRLKVLYEGGCSCKSRGKKVINLLVSGQTGAGKTTLIDCLINFLLGVKFYDRFRYKLVDERDLIKQRQAPEGKEQNEQEMAKAAQIHSLTSDVAIYHIPSDHIIN